MLKVYWCAVHGFNRMHDDDQVVSSLYRTTIFCFGQAERIESSIVDLVNNQTAAFEIPKISNIDFILVYAVC